jgi:Carboxypeptidase regulatory-like domain
MKTKLSRILKVLAPVLLVFLVTGSANAATVRGRLVHSNGYPAAGVAVTVFSQGTGRSSPAYTGGDGMYYLNNVPPGYYYLEVWSYPGGAPAVYQIQVYEPYTDIPPTGVP